MTREEIEKEIKENNEWIDDCKLRIKQYEESNKDLHAQLEKCNNRWRAKKSEYYWFIDDIGRISSDFDNKLDEDNFRYNTLNYFKTREQAEAYRQAKLDVAEKECKIGSFPNTYINSRAYFTNVQYEFETKAEANEFEEKLKLILNVKGE